MTRPVFGVHIPFAEHLGVKVISAEPGQIKVGLELRPEFLNSWQVAHGGVIMTLLDFALGMALRSSHPGARGVATVELKVNFIAPGRGNVTAEGRVLHHGSSLSVCEGEAYDASGVLIAKAVGTFKLVRSEPPATDP